MPERPSATGGLRLCDSAALLEKGRAVGFDVLQWGRPSRAFALRFDGRVVAYLNRCAHVPAELDWQPGEFFDADRSSIVCAIHGASYEPTSGRCVGGPCGRGRLIPIPTTEHDGEVRWHPSAATREAPVAESPSVAGGGRRRLDPPANTGAGDNDAEAEADIGTPAPDVVPTPGDPCAHEPPST